MLSGRRLVATRRRLPHVVGLLAHGVLVLAHRALALRKELEGLVRLLLGQDRHHVRVHVVLRGVYNRNAVGVTSIY